PPRLHHRKPRHCRDNLPIAGVAAGRVWGNSSSNSSSWERRAAGRKPLVGAISRRGPAQKRGRAASDAAKPIWRGLGRRRRGSRKDSQSSRSYAEARLSSTGTLFGCLIYKREFPSLAPMRSVHAIRQSAPALRFSLVERLLERLREKAASALLRFLQGP